MNEIRRRALSERPLWRDPLPHFYFHTENGERFADEDGVELADEDAARAEAVKVMGEILLHRAPTFWHTGVFRVIVMDAEQKPVVVLTASAGKALN